MYASNFWVWILFRFWIESTHRKTCSKHFPLWFHSLTLHGIRWTVVAFSYRFSLVKRVFPKNDWQIKNRNIIIMNLFKWRTTRRRTFNPV
jgi:hypothetical protein